MNKKIAAIFIPLLLMLLWVAKLEYQLHNGHVVRLPVGGYDPRDLLSGHYLIYTVDYGLTDICKNLFSEEHRNQRNKYCVCLHQAPEQSSMLSQASWGGYCDTLPSDCNVYLQGTCNYRGFTADIERFFIPEEFAPVLGTVPPNSSIEVAISPDGSGIVANFFVGDTQLFDYAREELKRQNKEKD